MSPDYWAIQSPVTHPGKAATSIDDLPADLSALREASSQLICHYRAGGDPIALGVVPASRRLEIHTRYADALLDLVLSRGAPSLSRERKPSDRALGCCRDATVLFLALARHKALPARARVGFATYLRPGWMIDHVVAEVWDGASQRWRLVDPEMPASFQPEKSGGGRTVDWLDLEPDEFVTGPRAWRAARAGTMDPTRFVVDPSLELPGLRGWPYLAHNVIHDLAALNKTEMLLWDIWGMQLDHDAGSVPDVDATILDEISAMTANPDIDPAVALDLISRNGLKIPEVVTRLDPNDGSERQIDVSRVIQGL